MGSHRMFTKHKWVLAWLSIVYLVSNPRQVELALENVINDVLRERIVLLAWFTMGYRAVYAQDIQRGHPLDVLLEYMGR